MSEETEREDAAADAREWYDQHIEGPLRVRRAKFKAIITPEWVMNEIRHRYESWTYGPEPELTATTIACVIYQDIAEERLFASVITPHTDRILRKLRDDGLVEASYTIKDGRECLVYNRPDYRNPNNVRWPNNR